MTKIDAVQVNLIYLIFNSSNFLVDTNDSKGSKLRHRLVGHWIFRSILAPHYGHTNPPGKPSFTGMF